MPDNGQAVYKSDAIILGGGPAGASCALWLKQNGYEPHIVEKRATLGGLQNDNPYANNWIAGTIGLTGIEYAQAIDSQIRELKIRTSCGVSDAHIVSVSGGFAVNGAESGLQFRTEAPFLVIATGVTAATGGLEAGEDIIIGPGLPVEQADFSGSKVAILGGGDNGFENYSFIRRGGAREIRLFARTVRARRDFVDLVPARDVLEGCYDADPRNMTVNGEAFDKFVVLYGWRPNTGCVRDLGLKLTGKGFVATGFETAETSLRGAYAIGEVAHRAHPCCVTAMADGVVAAKAIQNEIERKSD